MTLPTGSPRRQVFDFERWREHRNVDRYTRHMVGILQCALLRLLHLNMH